MIRAAIAFFVLAIVSFLFGLGGVAGLSMDIAKLLVGVFVFLTVLSLGLNLIRGSSSRPRI